MSTELDNLPAIDPAYQREAAQEVVMILESVFPKKKLSLRDAIVVLAVFFAAPAYAAGWTDADVHAFADRIVMAESSGNPNAQGDGGKSRGLMQLTQGTWEMNTTAPWSRAFEPALNRQIGEKEIRRIVNIYRSRGIEPSAAHVAWTYNTGSFIKRSIPRTDRHGKPHPWTVSHPNRIYRSIYLDYFKGDTANDKSHSPLPLLRR